MKLDTSTMLFLYTAALAFLASAVTAAETGTGNWTVDSCIAIKMAGELNIFPDVEDVNKTIEVTVPATAKASGSCKLQENVTNQTERIDLAWSDVEETTKKPLERFLNLTFKLNATAHSPFYGLYRVDGYYETRHYAKNVTDDKTNKTVLVPVTEYVVFTTFEQTTLELKTPVNMTYLCQDIGKISMHSELHDTLEPKGDSGRKLENVTFTATNVMINAFRPANLDPGQFQTALDCTYRPSDVVPIIVGCALAGTVLLVLVAYLVGRRRNRAAGYQSV